MFNLNERVIILDHPQKPIIGQTGVIIKKEIQGCWIELDEQADHQVFCPPTNIKPCKFKKGDWVKVIELRPNSSNIREQFVGLMGDIIKSSVGDFGGVLYVVRFVERHASHSFWEEELVFAHSEETPQQRAVSNKLKDKMHRWLNEKV